MVTHSYRNMSMCVGRVVGGATWEMQEKKAVYYPNVTHSSLQFPTHLRSTPLVAVNKLSSDGGICRRFSAIH